MFGKKNKDEKAEAKPIKTQKTANMKKLEDLYYAAEEARKHAYAPYSDFRVGAALLVKPNEDSVLPINKIYTGVNIENGSYGATLCAERVAFAKAISDGVLEYDIGENPFVAIAVSAGEEEALPCGICRQFMSEFAPEITIVTKADGQIRIRNLMQLLPESFQLNKEEKEAVAAVEQAADAPAEEPDLVVETEEAADEKAAE
ncbi:MAG: cytidine deaminase [Clostridiales bacterium]|nr:cytidine deaminase [Clostridiales bacterium]